MNKVKVTKLSEADNALYKAGNPDTYKYGEANNDVSTPIDYWLEGEALVNPIEGRFFRVNRRSRNGILIEGYFQTSQIKKVENLDNGYKLITCNSVYLVEFINEYSV